MDIPVTESRTKNLNIKQSETVTNLGNNTLMRMDMVQATTVDNADSEREDGEIVDDLDELSEISSEEEFFLRQRLQVLESYNNVLERQNAKNLDNDEARSSERMHISLSEISAVDLEEFCTDKNIRFDRKKRRKKESLKSDKNKDSKRKERKSRKRPSKYNHMSSDESEDEYRNKRRKLANAVRSVKDKNSSSLKTRITKMLSNASEDIFGDKKSVEPKESKKSEEYIGNENNAIVSLVNESFETNKQSQNSEMKVSNLPNANDTINLCSDDEVKILPSNTTESSLKKNDGNKQAENSDEDIELLRLHALKTKSDKLKPTIVNASDIKSLHVSEEEDNYTEELRMICLKSALLKKAIELKAKQKLQKKLSQSSNFKDDFALESCEEVDNNDIENNTDIESVDMDIGSDVNEKTEEQNQECQSVQNEIHTAGCVQNQEEIEEDEDLLRAKLLTSLSNKISTLVDNKIVNDIEEIDKEVSIEPKSQVKVPQPKPFIIQVGESDSEGEHEATKNLMKLHKNMNLAEQPDFQQKLDIFLKSARMQVENEKLPDVVQDPQSKSKPKKFVPKTVDHLPKSDQNEYKNLVKRMAELEKIKRYRQSLSTTGIKVTLNSKDTLKPRNITVEPTVVKNNIEEQITLSRKKIANESATILKLKEQAKNLLQKYNIALAELKNVSTAININKKEQRVAQMRLSRIQSHHQNLLKRMKHQPFVKSMNNSNTNITRQKENNPQVQNSDKSMFNTQMLKSLKVSVANNLMNDKYDDVTLLDQCDVTSNKKIVKIPDQIQEKKKLQEDLFKSHIGSAFDMDMDIKMPECVETVQIPKEKEDKINEDCINVVKNNNFSDYRSPLEALETVRLIEDPNAVLCPFEVGGHCRDVTCKYFHPPTPPIQ